MQYFIKTYLPYLLSLLTIYSMWMAGSQREKSWAVALVNQALWLVWIIAASAWGLLPMNLALWIVYTRNHLKWNERGRVARKSEARANKAL